MTTNHNRRLHNLETHFKNACPECSGKRLKVNTMHDGDTPVPDDARCSSCGRIIEALNIVIRRVPSGATGVHGDAC